MKTLSKNLLGTTLRITNHALPSFRFFLLPIFLFLTACGQAGSPTPEMAVLQKVLASRSHVDLLSVHIVQKQELMDHVFFLVTLKTTSPEGKAGNCNALYETFFNAQKRWSAVPGHFGCSDAAPFGVEWDWSGGGQAVLAGSKNDLYSYIYGKMVNEDIKSVIITWEDGKPQAKPVNDGYYLAMRPGQFDYRSVEGLDSAGKHVHTETFTSP